MLRSCHTAGRDVWNNFLGNEGYSFVAIGNLLCSRMALLLLLCWARNIRWVVEQPEHSSLPNHPRFQQILAIGKVPRLNAIAFVLAIHFGFDSLVVFTGAFAFA